MAKRGSDSAAEEYDWERRAKYYVIEGRQNGPNALIWNLAGPPTGRDAEQGFVEANRLNHGDVVNFGSTRDTESKIVCRDADAENFRLLSNPDDSGSGYLTIPIEVLGPVRDALSKYQDVMEHIENENGLINFHLSSEDKWLKDKFPGAHIPDEWEFSATFSGKYLEDFAIKTPSRAWQEFDLGAVTWNTIVDTLHSRQDEAIVRFAVRVSLEGEKLQQYKESHSEVGNKYSWISAKPAMPSGWLVETGMACAGADHRKWIWKLSGPQSLREQAKQSVAAFLNGYDFDFVDQDSGL